MHVMKQTARGVDATLAQRCMKFACSGLAPSRMPRIVYKGLIMYTVHIYIYIYIYIYHIYIYMYTYIDI